MTSREDAQAIGTPRGGRGLGHLPHSGERLPTQLDQVADGRQPAKRPPAMEQAPQEPTLPIPPPPEYPPPPSHRGKQQPPHRGDRKRRRNSRSPTPLRRSRSRSRSDSRRNRQRGRRRREDRTRHTPSPDVSGKEGRRHRRPTRRHRSSSSSKSRSRSKPRRRRHSPSPSVSPPQRRRGEKRSRRRSMDSSLSSVPDRKSRRHARHSDKRQARRRWDAGSRSTPPRRRPPRERHAENSPRAGVVSEEEDGARHQHHHQNHQRQENPLPPPPPKVKEAGGPQPAAKRRSSRSSSRDDTIGHFKGREGTVIADRYRIEREVGVGTFGRVLECLDLKRQSRSGTRDRQRPPSNGTVAIKVVRNVKRYYESALIEADIVDDVNRRGGRGVSHCAIMYDAFTFAGHYCMVFEKLGPSLYDFQKRQKYRPFPLICVRDFAKQLLETLEFLHSFRLIHTDLKPENILLVNGREVKYKGQYIPESTKIKVIDFGGATYDNDKKSSVVNTRQYRAPEVILGVGWSMPSDLWSIGCILAELYKGELLFATHDNIEHLALIEQVIGPFPRRMLKRSKNAQLVHEAFDSMGAHRMERILPPESLAYVKRIGSLETLTQGADTWFLRLLRRILVTDPDERATARECLRKL